MSFLQAFSKKDMDGRDKPGHDSGKMAQYDPEHALGSHMLITITRFLFRPAYAGFIKHNLPV
jgi:hypothetical protein